MTSLCKHLGLLLALFLGQGHAANGQEIKTYFCNQNFENIPILQNGRIKPLVVHTEETIKNLIGKNSFQGLNATTLYCLLSLESLGMAQEQLKLMAKIEHVELKALLNMPESDYYLSFRSLAPEIQRLEMKAQSIKIENSLKKSINKLLNQFGLYQNITSGQNWRFASIDGSEIKWTEFSEFITKEKIEAEKNHDPFQSLILQSKKDYDSIKGETYKLEFTYSKMHLTQVALVLSLLALAALTLFKKFSIALGLSFLTVATQILYIVLRVIISGRAPITNMYETVLFSGLGAFVLALILGHFKKEKLFLYMGLAYNVCTLFMNNFASGMLNPSIGPLVPVLRDNFWLSTHVTTIILSYGALALSWIMANTILVKKKWASLSPQDENEYADIIYTCLKFGTTLLAAGIILGGVWADYSWGRFWGWDPKETWSLIVLCLYVAILHGKYTSWIPTKRFIPLVALAFLSVMMAWFGVNYILASGLHSYGFSEGGAIFLGTFFALQIALIAISWQRAPLPSQKPR